MDRRGSTLVKKRIDWVCLQQMGSWWSTEFVRGYSMVLNFETDTRVKAKMSQCLEDLMDNTDLYGWNRVCAYHAAWLNQLEQDRCSWSDTDH